MPKKNQKKFFFGGGERERTYIGIKLANKAGEIIVLEIRWKDPLRELQRFDHDEAVISFSPSDQMIR